ncbi:hypothetical protein DFH01_19210 [Falsiroseomonas bella]|uniref:PEP-CTERM sorting domain-containing protein n=1 Tax=Falsiroseomonas bella TaxID=2184016 RepID=A0A317FDS1_9PROT|nr:PEP-CTERM sorting domain-containing protein [Falsiroseomonas bella]PWS35718.1 hypothetical protein DFH01_19210 [Falsiroseomonas bella]
MLASSFVHRAALAVALLGGGPAAAAIQSVSYGTAVLGSHAGNLIANGSFEVGASGNRMWTGNGPYTGANVGGPGVSIPSWNAAYPSGAYGWWGPYPNGAFPCADGANCVYFGNWITQPSQPPSFGPNGVVSFPGPVAFTNTVPQNQGQVTLSQTVTLTAGDAYLLDFWTTGEGPPTMPSGVFGLTIGSQSLFLEAVAGNRRYYVHFQADAATTTIGFTNWGHVQIGQGIATELVLDDVILNRVAVPAPGTLPVLAVGAMGLLWARRRFPAAHLPR